MKNKWSQDLVCHIYHQKKMLHKTCSDTKMWLPVAVLLQASVEERTICMRKGCALNVPNELFLSNEDQVKIYLLWDNEYLKMSHILTWSFEDWNSISRSTAFISLYWTSFLYTLEKLEKALKIPWTFWEKKTKHWYVYPFVRRF